MRLLFVIALVGWSVESYAFRCGTHLVREDDHYIEVLRACGEPVMQEQWIEEGVVSRRIYRSLPYRELTSGDVSVRLWTYNFGSQKFMRQLQFRKGYLKKIEKIKYRF